MIELLTMWVLVEVLGLLSLPLTMVVFHNLADRGWAFSKTLGLALLAYSVWLPLNSLHVLPFSQLCIAGIALLLVAGCLFGWLQMHHVIRKVLRLNLLYVICTEFVFLGMVFLLGWLRSFGPDIRSYEMFMDEGFIAAIMRSPHLPPNDMWFAGYPINYYYYAHYTIAVLAKLLGQSPSIAFNTGIALFFGLTAVNLFGVTCNIVAYGQYTRKQRERDVERPETISPSLLGALPYGLLCMVMALVLGNLAATQQWWKIHGEATPFDWFAPSRVIEKTINEFPAFSFLLSCFHAHVLALAFTILAIGLALNVFLEPKGRGMALFGPKWRGVCTLLITALVLGSLFTMNGWDFPTYTGLTLACIALQQWLSYERRLCIELVWDSLKAGASLLALSLLCYLPFYLHFISPSQGIGIVGPADRSPLNDELLIYGLLAFVFLSLLLTTALRYSGWLLSPSAPAQDERPQVGRLRLSLFVGVVIVGAILVGCIILLPSDLTFVVTASIALTGVLLLVVVSEDRARAFTLLLGAAAFALIALCEIFFLKDVFASSYPRMNTIFKFYFQAWALLSIAASVGVFLVVEDVRHTRTSSLLRRWLQGSVQVIWSLAFLLLCVASMVYPLLAPIARYERLDPATQHYSLQRSNSLDGLTYLASDGSHPGDYAAIRWLNSHVQGSPVIVEAVGPDYSNYGRVSAFTGLPTLMGWAGHEYQWRVNWLNDPAQSAQFDRRGKDVDAVYTNTDATAVLSVLARYQAQYLYVGPLEYQKYSTVNLHRFASFMQTVYNANGVTIYKVK